MSDFNIANASPMECLETLDRVIAELADRDDEQTTIRVRSHLERIAELSGSTAVQKMAAQGDKDEMLECLREIITQNIVAKAFDL